VSPSEAITIQHATALHTCGILECLRSAFEPYRSDYTPAAYEDTVLPPESLSRRLQEMTVLVAITHSGSVVGTLAYKLEEYGDAHLRGMAVRRECQGSGIAEKLLAHAQAEIVEGNCSRITLNTTEPLVRAMSFYERHGFRRTGRICDFFGMPLIEYAKELRKKE
jgi:ribosomal protein S18 acetylase RimI-like enzyme